MMARVFFRHTAAVHRASRAMESGTLQPDISFATVSGMTALEVAFQPLSVHQSPVELGIATGRSFSIVFDSDLLPTGAAIRENDRVLIESNTYVLREAILRTDDKGSWYHCVGELRTDE